MDFRGSWQVLTRARTRRTLRFWNRVIGDDNTHSFACVLLLPTGTQYPAGSPKSLKSQNFDGFSGFLTGSCEGAYFVVRNWAGFCQNAEKARITSQISLLTKQTHFNRLSVFCLFAPSPQKYKSIFWGPLTLKSQNFDEILTFLLGFWKS